MRRIRICKGWHPLRAIAAGVLQGFRSAQAEEVGLCRSVGSTSQGKGLQRRRSSLGPKESYVGTYPHTKLKASGAI